MQYPTGPKLDPENPRHVDKLKGHTYWSARWLVETFDGHPRITRWNGERFHEIGKDDQLLPSQIRWFAIIND